MPDSHLDPPGAVDAIRIRMELFGYTQTDLAALLGARSRASEILGRRRGLTMAQANRLHREWHIPADIPIRPLHVP